jgi:non-specific serine/threonine protein kinase
MIGENISHYKILEKLGEGGMGIVYKAEDTKLDRKVTLKFLPKESTKDNEAKERFKREAKAAAALNHPNIVTIYEINEHEDQTYIAMEYVEGKTLKESLTPHPLPLTKVVDYTIQICKGLSAAHNTSIIHRDIKPQNIIINNDDQVKILDFGLAKLKGVSQLTKEHSTLGTIHYMSPEQIQGHEVDQRTDIWSLGIILYEMIIGKLPFKGDYEQAIVYSVLNEEQEPVTAIRTGVPQELERIIDKALAKKPSERYQHVDDMMVDLKNISERSKKDITETKKEIFRNKKRRFRRYILPIILLLTMIVVVGGYFIFTGKESLVPAEKNINETKWKNSIAVLPFVDMSEKSDQEYFCDGMTEDIITKLTRINELKVISRTSVMRYKNTRKDIRDIGAELDVSTILEGSVRKEKDRIRVTAQLININDGSHLWADTFDHKLEDLFSLQDEVSRSIADALKLQFGPGVLDAEKPKNFEAYDYYLKMGHWTNIYLISKNEEDFLKVLKYSKLALEADPKFAKIYASLAYAHEHHYSITEIPSDRETVVKNCLIAYRLNPELPESNVAIGYVYFKQGRHEKTALHLKKALSLNSNSSGVLQVTGLILYNSGFYRRAIKYYKKAEELDPFYLYSPQVLGHSFKNLGETDLALFYYKKALNLAPTDLDNMAPLINIFIMNNKDEEAEKYLREAEKINRDYSAVKTSRAFWFAAIGKKREALSIKKISKWRKGQLYSLLGMKDEALKLISEGSEDSYLRLLKHPFYKNLQGEKRYKDLLQKLKIEYELMLKFYKEF